MTRAEVAVTLTFVTTVLLASCGGGGDADGSAGGGAGGGACLASGVSDTGVHAPPTNGPFPYSPPGSWLPGQAGFPAVGDSYIDPVFGTTVRRITDEFSGQSFSDIYATNGWWNADASLLVHRTSTDHIAINAATAAVVQTGVPGGTGSSETSFDPVDPDVWYFYQNDELWQFRVTTGATALLKKFPAAADNSLGGSVDWIDRSGRYFLVAYNGALHIWDRTTDKLYANSIPFDALLSGGWAGISPDGNYVITATGDFTSYLINHESRTLSTTGIMFWNLCGDHGDLISASDGRTYLVTFECNNQAAVYRVDVTIQHTGLGDISDVAQQQADNVMLIDTDFDDSGHFSCVSSGPNRDWCFVSFEARDDSFTDQDWRPYKQEIVAVQVVPPFAVRRLAHHRSRSTDCPTCPFGGYYHQPRLSASWDGRRVAFASNFGFDAGTVEYADIYVLDSSCAP